MDAPIGYISATKQWAADTGNDWKKYWQDEETALVHFIGKDNIVFHCLIFPAILNAHGNYVLPVNVPANQFMNLEGKKISTSKNWAVWVHEYLEDLPGKQDELRYSMIKNMPESKDSEFTWKGYQDANNNELVNNLANFVNRVLVLTGKYYDGVVPDFDGDLMITGPADENEMCFHDSELMRLHDSIQSVGEAIRRHDFRGGLKAMMEISSQGNQLLQFNEPWKLQKTDPATVQAVMNLALQYVASLAVVMRPFLPFTSDRLRTMLGMDPINERSEWLDMCNLLCEGQPIINSGHSIGEVSYLFTRMDDELIEKQRQKLESSLLPDDIVGQRVTLLANLAPRKIRGVESKGMILMAEDAEGKLGFVAPPDGWVNGSTIS